MRKRFSELYPDLMGSSKELKKLINNYWKFSMEKRADWDYDLKYASQTACKYALEEAKDRCKHNFLDPNYGVSSTPEESDYYENLMASFGYEEAGTGDYQKYAIDCFAEIGMIDRSATAILISLQTSFLYIKSTISVLAWINLRRENIFKSTPAKTFWLIGGPVILLLISLILVFPQVFTAAVPSTEIPSSGLFPDMQLELIIEPLVENLDKGYFSAQITMNLGIEENSTRQTDYNIHIIPRGLESAIYGVSVPFDDLQSSGPYYSLNFLTREWTTYNKHSYSAEFTLPIISRTLERFPGDFYASSTVYVWFSGDFYPEVKLSPTSSVPRGFVLTLTNPVLVDGTEFYTNILHPFDRLFIGKPSKGVLAFGLVIQRDFQSMLLFLFYDLFVLCVTFDVLMISRFRIKPLKDRLEIFVGLAIANIAFLWSIRQVTNVITWPELLLALILGSWLTLEVRDTLTK